MNPTIGFVFPSLPSLSPKKITNVFYTNIPDKEPKKIDQKEYLRTTRF